MLARTQAMPKTSKKNGSPSVAPPLRILLHAGEWSEWARQVLRGVLGFAHGTPRWRLYIACGPLDAVGVSGTAAPWDGVITHFLFDLRAVRRLMRVSKVVSYSASVPKALLEMPCVRVDEAKVAASIGRHLAAGGFRRLAWANIGASSVAFENYRLRGLSAFAAEQNWPLEVRAGNVKATPHVLARWIARLQKPVGIAVWNMTEARRLIEACQRAGASIPNDVAVVSWDDDALLAEGLEPSISGVVLPAEQLGYEAARLLDRVLRDEPASPEPVLVEPSGVIHVRQSSDVSTLEDRDVHLANQYIREHAHESFKVAHIVAHLRTSRRKLEQDYRRTTNRTLHDAITEAHLERAKQLLLETSWPIEVVAERAGFGTARQFHAVFMKRERLTPKQYRVRFGAI